MNNKTIIEFGFRIILRIMEISECVIRLGLWPRRITPSSISIILHKILSLIFASSPAAIVLYLLVEGATFVVTNLQTWNGLRLILLLLVKVLKLTLKHSVRNKETQEPSVLCTTVKPINTDTKGTSDSVSVDHEVQNTPFNGIRIQIKEIK